MPPLVLSDGNLLFFHDSVGTWNHLSGFQVRFRIIVVLALASPNWLALIWHLTMRFRLLSRKKWA